MDSLNKWIKTNSYNIKGKEPMSHLLLDGGIVYIPRHQEKTFLKLYAEELRNKVKLYYVEVRPNIFKYMIDFDISDNHYLSNDEIMNIVRIVNNKMNEFYDKHLCICICCTSSKKFKLREIKEDKIINDNDVIIKKDGKTYIQDVHTGIHLIYPKLFVTADSALFLRDNILEELMKLVKINDKTWDDMFDKRIYKSNGYRMVGSDKLDKGQCENREYWPLFVLNGSNEQSIMYLSKLENYEDLMYETSIRYVPENYFVIDNMGMIPKNMKINMTKMNKLFNIPVFNKCSKEQVVIEHYIKKCLPQYEKYGDIVKEVLRTPMGNLLVKTNCKYCMNIGREHNSCGIFFMIYDKGLVQKCLCPCSSLNGRLNGYCYDYTSQNYEIPKDLYMILFPSGCAFPNYLLKKEDEDLSRKVSDKKNIDKKNIDRKVSDKKIENKIPKKFGKVKKVKKQFKEGLTSRKALMDSDLETCGLLMNMYLQVNKNDPKIKKN